MTIAVALFLGYPYIKKYTSNSMQDKINSLETQGTILKKFATIITNKKSNEIQKNDNTENKETGK